MTTLYLDMDDVIADFQSYAIKKLGKKSHQGKWDDDSWNSLKENQRLYRDLDKTKQADDLVNACRELCEKRLWSLKFLTAVPKGNDVKWAFYDKVLWAQLRYPDIPVMFGPYSKDKHVHCLPGDILIDDRSDNIKEWIAAGGIGIQHKRNIKDTLKILSQL